MKTVFVNPERCIGCRQCEFACAVAHSASHDPVAAMFEQPLPRSRIHVAPGATFHSSFPARCRHCDPAPCEQVCPTGAIYRYAAHNLVLIDPRKCIACAMCAMVCPFDAVSFHLQANRLESPGTTRSIAVKCDGCIERLRVAQEPACSEVCKVDALVYGELNELVKSARERGAAVVLSAVAMAEPETVSVPEHIKGWRAWGRSADAAKAQA